ncbi:hypothetical protein A2617_04535 [Candidatus Daviesbacteria bacterium RIFOXYD1_FULL_41_10]|uniref:Uncharacterized protein n=1 Tax=Candidatus Daviesbacteria bacterium RIFOXYD1_FULL_41_10 TaxID=1797801 RepID=A0A1F5N0Z9_9BACT|nr:MAG: hypothetical protein A2617_04535 [Candidatus Daviesbacteria bacterium RIFOXYD1_FULL_41_10]
MKLQQKGFAPIIILVGIGILAGIALMIPLPYYQSGTQVNCGSVNGYSPACSVNSGWKLGPSIWQKIFPQYVKQPTIKEDSQKVITESPAPSGAGEIANPDLIGANWKTYTNDTYKFSLKYPPSYSIEEKSGIDTKLFSIIIKSPSPTPGGGYPQPLVEVVVFENDANDLSGWLNKHTTTLSFDDPAVSVANSPFFYRGVKNKKDSLLGGQKAVTFEASAFESFSNPTITEVDNYIIVLNLDNDNEVKDPNLKDIYPHVLSTFKFTQ